MGCRLLVGHEEGEARTIAAMFDSVTGWAFGPIFEGIEGHPTLENPDDEGTAFIAWCKGDRETCEQLYGGSDLDGELSTFKDPRAFNSRELEERYGEWRTRRMEATTNDTRN